jgi:hypothetical protein
VPKTRIFYGKKYNLLQNSPLKKETDRKYINKPFNVFHQNIRGQRRKINNAAFNQVSNQSCNKNDDINKPFKIFHQNIRGVQGKINELIISLLKEKPNIICLTEHHLTEYELVALYIPKYKLGSGYGRKKFKNGGVFFPSRRFKFYYH